MSWLQLSPRFKIDKEGDRVLTLAEVYLKVAERSNEFVHTADRDPRPGSHREVNCALESTSWKLNIYQSSSEFSNPNLLLVSQLVLITDPETKGNLTILDKTKSPGDEKDKDATMSFDADYEKEEAEKRFAHEAGDIVLSPIVNEEINSNYLWMMDSQSIILGGPILWKSEAVRFRHVNTGKYLQLLQEPSDDRNSEASETLYFTSCADQENSGTLFNVQDLNATDPFICDSKPVQIGQNGVWFERGEILEDSVFSYAVKGSKDKSVALSLIVQRYDGQSKSSKVETDANESTIEPLDIFTGLAIRRFLTTYNNLTILPKNDSVNTIWPAAYRYDLEFFQFLADKCIYFAQGFPISVKFVQLGIDKGDNKLLFHRQKLLKEQGTLTQVIEIIKKLVPMTERLERIRQNKNKRKRAHISDEEMAALNLAQTVLTKAFEIIYYSILDNPDNQLYVADYMPVLLSHLNSQPLAGKCVTEMLSKNMDLQETKIGTREIQIFVDKLRSSKMNAMYLQLLTSCCSCQGDGVDGNQTKVATMLFSDTNDIIINMHADYVRLNKLEWKSESLYLPTTVIAGSPLRGENLISKGLPQLSLAWTTNSIDYSPLGLFGRLSVNVEELFPSKFAESERRSGKQKMKKKSTEEQKAAVANYFIAEIFLSAEMCLDRNYIAMHKLDELFPYEVLVTILKIDVSPTLKAAAVRLLMCLHVDRDPQAKSKIPCLTRTWSDIKKNEEPQLPYVDVSRRYTFGLIQELISEHIKDMAGSQWDDLSRHMLKMLRTLIEFNFYGTTERMKDVIIPLIIALDRRPIGGISSTETIVEEVEEEPPVTTDQPDSSSPKKIMGGDEGKEEDRQMTEYIETTNNITLDGPIFEDEFNWYQKIWFNAAEFCQSVYSLQWRAAGVIPLLEDSNSSKTKTEVYVPPLRYSKAPIYELETMVEAVDILAFTQRVIEDRNISLLLRYFYAWESGSDERKPAELFEQAVLDSNQLSLGKADFDNIMIDTLMFVHTPLVQSTLEVVMAHHSMRRILLDNARNVQLLASHKRERQFRMVDQMLKQLEQNAETQELWGELETDADRAINKQTQDILKELIDMCRIRRYVLEFDEDFMADTEIQDLYRNLGCFDISMKVMNLLDSVEEDEDGQLGEPGQNTKNLCLLCNELIYWFLLGNPKNQELGYLQLDLFLDTLDEEINSHLTIRAIFKDNEALMKQVPHSHLTSLVDRIVKDGKSHHYLSLFAAIPNVGEKNIAENQFEIVKILTSPGRLQKIGCFLCSVDDPQYEEKRELMKPFEGRTNVTLEELPPLLAYHLMFLNVLSGCTVGRLNVTSVEAKVQSVFAYVDIIESILDPDTILVAKLSMLRFLFNAVIEVEMLIPGLEKSPVIWELLDSFMEVIKKGKKDLEKVEQYGWDSSDASRQEIEYLIICIYIIKGFFSTYFDMGSFKPETSKKGSRSKFKLTAPGVNQLVGYFFNDIKAVYDLNSSRLSTEVKTNIFTALEVLKTQATKYAHLSNEQDSKARHEGNRKADFIHADLDSSKCRTDFDPLEDVNSPTKSKDASEIKLIGKYNEFLKLLDDDKEIQYKAENENVAFISILESLPFINDRREGDVRYESLIKKLVYHIRENIRTVDNTKRMDARIARTSAWIIRAFRTMIENRMGMSIYERDDDGGLEQDQAAAPVVEALNTCGATALCLDLIAVGIDEKLQLEAVKLGVALLFKEGGALEVQQIMNNHLRNTNSELFFKQVKLTLYKLQQSHQWFGTVVLPEGEEPILQDEILLVRFLQLMCEGHYLPNQDIMREQPNNPVSYNLLDEFVSYLNCLSRIPCRTSTAAAIRLSATILEVIQGPCEGNQVHFALNTELVETLNRVNRSKLVHDCVAAEEIDLKKISIDIFQGLLEGQGEKSVVYDRVLSVIHLDIIQIMSKKALYPGFEENEEQIILQTECVVLLQMFCNYRVSLYDELGISKNVEDIVGSGTAMIEVIWRGDIHRRFFHVPRICDYLAKSSKDNLIEFIDRSSPENKLIDFLSRSHDLYREVKHQQYLTELGVAGIFSRQVQSYATWITFILAILINAFFIATYSFRPGEITLAPVYNTITTYLNVCQVTVATFNLILACVVRSPVIVQSFFAQGKSLGDALLMAAVDPLTVYYTIYLLIAYLGIFVENYYCSLLLLDIIVKDATTRDVLNAIVTPRKALFFTFIFMLFVIYIFAFFIFYFFPDDISGNCTNLYHCAKWTLSYGFQNGGGVGDSFDHTTGMRLILDILFFMIVLVILVNAFMGMIIDTFGSLRAEKMVRTKDTLEVCFICNIDKQIFDRASDESEGFKTHVKIDHNIWNYLYFIFLLWEQDRDDDDGLEQYVRRAIEAEEIIWFPLHKAMRLENVATPTEIIRKELSENILSSQNNVVTKLNDFQSDVQSMLTQLVTTLKNDGLPQENSSVARINDINVEFEEDNSEEEGDSGGDAHFGKHISICVVKIEGLQLFHPNASLNELFANGKPSSPIKSSRPKSNSVHLSKTPTSARRTSAKVPMSARSEDQTEHEEYRPGHPHICEYSTNLNLSNRELATENDVSATLKEEESYYHELCCRIVTDNDITNLPGFIQIDHQRHALYFNSSAFLPLFDNVVNHDKRKFQLQIIHGVSERAKQSFVASVDINCKDLISTEEDSFLVRELLNSNEEFVGSITIRINCIQAKEFGRPTIDEKDDEAGRRTHRSANSNSRTSSARDKLSKTPSSARKK
jgi:hypothetical protein